LWLRGTVEGNITPPAGTLTLEVALTALKEATDSGQRTLMMLGVRAFKLFSSMEKLAEVERGVKERPADFTSGSPALPALKFTEQQRAAATASFDTNLAPMIEKLEAEVRAAAAKSTVDVTDVGRLSTHMEALRLAVSSRAAGQPIAPALQHDAIPVVQGVPVELVPGGKGR